MPKTMPSRLLPDVLKDLWATVDDKRFTAEQFCAEEERLLDEYRDIWKTALILEGLPDLKSSLLWELASYLNKGDLQEVERLAQNAIDNAKKEWEEKVHGQDRQSIEQFYEHAETTLYELMYWHTLEYDSSPLAYVGALQFAQQHGCRNCLDFGSGVGSGAIVFARNGLEVTLADISTPLLRFCEWRLRQRALPAQFIDLKTRKLPVQAFDIVTAMDVFEHLVDPCGTAGQLWESLKPGGFLFGRFHAEEDEDQPQHIVRDFGATFEHMERLGFVPVWQDEWLWGHQAFQKT